MNLVHVKMGVIAINEPESVAKLLVNMPLNVFVGCNLLFPVQANITHTMQCTCFFADSGLKFPEVLGVS
jgi:hypothetical protein